MCTEHLNTIKAATRGTIKLSQDMNKEDTLKSVNPGVFHEVITKNGYALEKGCFRDSGVVDVGAHIGTFTYMAHTLGEAQFVLGIEPNKKSFFVLRDLFLDTANVQVRHAAMSYDTQPVSISDEDNVSSIGTGTVVDAITLRQVVHMCSWWKSKRAILKMDIEGFEYDVLWSASRETIQFFNSIYLETHVDANHNMAMNLYLQRLGFNLKRQYQMFKWDVLPDGTQTNWQPLNAWVSKFDR